MDGTTKWWQSKGVLGGIVAVLAGFGGLFGVSLDESLRDQLVEIITASVTIVGGALSWYGRVVATKKVSS